MCCSRAVGTGARSAWTGPGRTPCGSDAGVRRDSDSMRSGAQVGSLDVSTSGGGDLVMFDPIRDIAVRKGAEEELRRSRDHIEIILRGVADAITAQDQSGHLIYVNDAAVRPLGYPSAAALLATPVAEVMQQFELLDEMGRPFPLDQ